MEHLFIHTIEVLRRAPSGSEDGTPIMGGWNPLPWSDADGAPTFGAGRLDDPRDAHVVNGDVTSVTVQKSTVLTSADCPAKELDRIRVTKGGIVETWQASGITPAEGMHGVHHIEISVTREVNR